MSEFLGKTLADIFDSPFCQSYTEQELAVLQQGNKILDKLELHLYRSGELGWCLTHKLPIYNYNEEIVGMLGVSIDIQEEKSNQPITNERIFNAVRYIQQHYDQSLSVEALAKLANISVSQFDRTFKKLFQMTPMQYIQKVRLENAITLLKQDLSITEISLLCDYSDHSAFSRRFKQLTALSPSQFKEATK